jgi:hypothetical protein
MSYDVGDAVRIETTVRDPDGALTNTTIGIAVTRPDGTAATASVPTSPSLGVYRSTVTVDQAGWWTWQWTASGAVVGVEGGQFYAQASRVLVGSLEELKHHLRINSAGEDGRLRDVITAVTDIMEPAVGPVVPRTFTEVHRLSGQVVAPRHSPLLSVTSLTPDLGAALDPSRYVVDTDVGVIHLRFWARGLYTLVLRAGHQPWPVALKEAGKIICQHEWQVRNGNGGRPSPDADQLVVLPGTGYLVPHRAFELMQPYFLPGLA